MYSTYFEYIENTLEGIQRYRRFEIDKSGKTSYRGDTYLNIIGDTIANLLGLYIGLNIRRSVGLLFAFLTALIIHWCDNKYFIEFFSFLLKK